MKRGGNSLWAMALRQLLKNRAAVAALCVVILSILTALGAGTGLIARGVHVRHQKEIVLPDGSRKLVMREYEPPSREFLCGTDIFGRDVFQRTLHGLKTALLIGLITAAIAIPIGLLAGAAAGYFGGFIDEVIVWFYSALSSIPWLLLLLSMSLIFGRGLQGVYLAIGLTSWVNLCRLVRAEVMKLKGAEYVQAARALGAGPGRILFRHIIPNVSHLVVITFTLQFCTAIKAEVILSYLGIGVELGMPSWGNMIQSARQELQRGAWWQFAAATTAMFVIVLAFNVLGDALRDALDPRLKI